MTFETPYSTCQFLGSLFFMFVLVVSIWIVLVRVRHRLMMMRMSVNSTRLHWIGMLVLMMCIVRVLMLVVQRQMDMRVYMLFREVKP